MAGWKQISGLKPHGMMVLVLNQYEGDGLNMRRSLDRPSGQFRERRSFLLHFTNQESFFRVERNTNRRLFR